MFLRTLKVALDTAEIVNKLFYIKFMEKLRNASKNSKKYQETQAKTFSFSFSRSLHYVFYATIVCLTSCIASPLKANKIHYQPLTAALPAKLGTNTVTPDWILNLPDISDDQPSIQWIDNAHLIYASPKAEDGQQKWKIETIDLSTGTQKFLTEGLMPKPSPDGEWIAFSKGEGKEKQLWIISRNGTDPKQISQVEGGLGVYAYSYDFAWAPNSKQIALKHQPFLESWERIEPAKSKIDLINITSGQSKEIASFDASIFNLSWFPNGEQLLFMKEHSGLDYNTGEDHTWVQSINITDGHVRTLAYFEGLQQALRPTSSPDGQFVAFTYDADNPDFNYMLSVGIVSTDLINKDEIPSIKQLTHELQLGGPKWSRDGKRIYVVRRLGAYRQIYAVDIKTGELTQITNVPLSLEGYGISPDGKQLVWIGQDAQGVRIIQTGDSNGGDVRDIMINPGASEDIALGEVREIEWEVSTYPVPMRGLLFLPLNYQEGTRYPLIVDIHGGDVGATIHLRGGILVSTVFEWHMWAAKGYAVFVPEFRSSGSFGSLAVTRDYLQEHDRFNCDIIDINAGVDKLISQGIVDSSRLAVIGHSAGSARANWLTVATHRYRAVISKEGWADEWITALKKSKPLKRHNQVFGGAPWEVPENYLKNSAIFHSSGATTPTLFLMGNSKLGGADEFETVHMLYNSLKGQGVETEYIKYEDEGHCFQRPENRRNALEKSIQWIDLHMKSNCEIDN